MKNQEFINSIETYETIINKLVEKLDAATNERNLPESQKISLEIANVLAEMKMDTIQIRTVQ